jgi:hypothetical protein
MMIVFIHRRQNSDFLKLLDSEVVNKQDIIELKFDKLNN